MELNEELLIPPYVRFNYLLWHEKVFLSERFIPREEHMRVHLTAQPFKEEIGCCSLKQKKSLLLSVDIDNPDDILPLVQ